MIFFITTTHSYQIMQTSIALTVNSDHTHDGLVGAKLVRIVDGKHFDTNLCTFCDKGMYDIQKLATICPECKIPVPILEGSHIFCVYCGKCGGSTMHELAHKPGECRACTDQTSSADRHKYCRKCNTCMSLKVSHNH